MAYYQTISFRPHSDNQDDFEALLEFFRENPGYSLNSIFNAYLPAITYAIRQQSYLTRERQKTTGEWEDVLYIRSDFGDVPVRISKHHRKNY